LEVVVHCPEETDYFLTVDGLFGFACCEEKIVDLVEGLAN